MNDADLLGYLRIHARTELGMVYRAHVCRLFGLAGRPCPGFRAEFLSIAGGQADELLEQAEARASMPWMLRSPT